MWGAIWSEMTTGKSIEDSCDNRNSTTIFSIPESSHSLSLCHFMCVCVCICYRRKQLDYGIFARAQFFERYCQYFFLLRLASLSLSHSPMYCQNRVRISIKRKKVYLSCKLNVDASINWWLDACMAMHEKEKMEWRKKIWTREQAESGRGMGALRKMEKEGNGKLRKLKDFWGMITIKQLYGIKKSTILR